MIEWGQHNRSLLLNVSMVPDAEMSHPDQRTQYQIETVSTPLINPHGRMTQEEFPETQELIIGTRTMPRADWVRARAFAYMTSLLHFDKLLQVPLVLCHEVGRIPADDGPRAPRYKELIELFLAPDLGSRPLPVRDDDAGLLPRACARHPERQGRVLSRRGVAGRPLASQRVTCSSRSSAADTSIASTPKHWISSTAFVAIEPRIVEQALRLNGALLELPFRSGLHIIEAGWNILEVYKGALTAQRVNPVAGAFEYRFDWSAAAWTSWDEWLQKVVWWRNRAGQS